MLSGERDVGVVGVNQTGEESPPKGLWCNLGTRLIVDQETVSHSAGSNPVSLAFYL
tara:strand:- start:764 stop:931 length:168 start_codon:yes stop_codon:yes gene_type:complete